MYKSRFIYDIFKQLVGDSVLKKPIEILSVLAFSMNFDRNGTAIKMINLYLGFLQLRRISHLLKNNS